MKVHFKNFINLTLEEKKIVLDWRNSDRIRSVMVNQDIIALPDHLAWIDRLQTKTDRLYFLACFDGVPVGVFDFVEIDKAAKTAEWGFYISPEYIGAGSVIQCMGIDYAFDNLGMDLLWGQVLENNLKVYESHKKNFFFEEDPSHTQKMTLSGKEVQAYGLSLKKAVWQASSGKLKQRLFKFFNVEDIAWDK